MWLVLTFIKNRGHYGATRDEISTILNMPYQSMMGHINQLKKRKLIVVTDDKRLSQYGLPNKIFRAVV